MFDVAKVDGISMSPSLMNGDLLLFSKRQQFVVGDIVLYRVGSGLLLVKRVDEIKNGIINLVSDNRWVESSLRLAGLSGEGVIGVVLVSFSKRRNFKIQIHSRLRLGFAWKRHFSRIFSTTPIKF